MVYFILKGKGWPSKDFKSNDVTKKSIHVAVNRKQAEEITARRDAETHQAMLKEEGYGKQVDFREDPNAKAIMKIGDEVKRMKQCGESKERIDRELNPEVAKVVKHK